MRARTAGLVAGCAAAGSLVLMAGGLIVAYVDRHLVPATVTNWDFSDVFGDVASIRRHLRHQPHQPRSGRYSPGRKASRHRARGHIRGGTAPWYAVELEELSSTPLDRLSWKPPKVSEVRELSHHVIEDAVRVSGRAGRPP